MILFLPSRLKVRKVKRIEREGGKERYGEIGREREEEAGREGSREYTALMGAWDRGV